MSQQLRHVGFIMDGNRRFAKRLLLHPTKGHEWGAKKLWDVIGWCASAGITQATFYAFSTENFNRPRKEFDYLMDLFTKECTALLKNQQVKKKGYRIRFIGRTWMFPPALQQLMTRVQGMSKDHTAFTVNIALGYGGRSEIVDAIKRIAEAVQSGTLPVSEINEEVVKEHLYLPDEPDLIIRTGGEQRTSNFLLFQSAYSEWFFLDTLWPEISEKDFLTVLDEYKKRERRFGR